MSVAVQLCRWIWWSWGTKRAQLLQKIAQKSGFKLRLWLSVDLRVNGEDNEQGAAYLSTCLQAGGWKKTSVL